MTKKYTLDTILCLPQKVSFTSIKNKTFFGVLLAFFAVSSALVNAQTVTIPAGNPDNPTGTWIINDPFGSYYQYERSAMIYTPAEIGTTGNISEVGFYVNSVNGAKAAVDVRIYMKMRTTLMTGASTYATELVGATQVFGPITIPASAFNADNWTTVTLTTPFNYTGGLDNNLQIIVETNAAVAANQEALPESKVFRCSTTTNQYFQYWDNNITPPSANGSRRSFRPNVQLKFSCLAPTMVTATSITGTSASIGFTSTIGNYIVERGPVGFTPGTGATAGVGGTITTGTTSPITISGLSGSTTYDVYVRALCTGGLGYSLNSTKISFTTGCSELPITVTQGFNAATIPICWKTQVVAGNPGSRITFLNNWTNPTASAFEGSNMVRYDSYLGAAGTEERLESAPMSSIGTTSVDVEFYFNRDSGYAGAQYLTEGVQVQYSLDGTSWTDTGDFIRRYSSTVAGWEKQTVTIPTDLANKASFYIGFKFRSEFGNNMYLDAAVIRPSPPAITITPSVPLPLCVGTAVTLTATSSHGYTYSWSPATGLNTTTGASVIATPSATTTYTVTGVSGSFTTTKKINVVVNPSPADFTLSVSAATVCRNSIQPVTANVGPASTVLVNENFNSGVFPTGFTTVVGAGDAIGISSSSNAGGATNEIRITGNSFSNVTDRVILGPFNTVGYSSLDLSWKNYLYHYLSSYPYSAIVQTSSNGTSWNNTSYNFNPVTSTQFPSTQNISITNGDVGSSTFYISFTLAGETFGAFYWYIDDIVLNAIGSTAIVWTPVTNLFTNAACTTAYVANAAAINIWAKPSANITYTATSSIGSCTKTKDVTFTIGGNSVYTAGSWSPTPTGNTSLVFNGNYSGTGNLTGCDCKVNSPAVVTIASGDVMALENELVVNGGSITFENNSSLIQRNSSPANSGAITYKRTANLKKLDYVYWSSPVTTISNFSSQSISPLTPANSIFKWIPTIPANVNGFGNWTNGVENMVSGKGYIVRGPNGFTDVAAPLTAAFVGTPANGVINLTMARGNWNGGNYSTGVSTTPGTNDDDNWNLVGNPYPSAIRAIDFLALNSPRLEGFIEIWTHGNPASTSVADPFYNDFVYNFNAADYITYNSAGASSGPGTYNGLIPAGQAFFVLVKHTATLAPTLVFANTMRSASYNNSQFFRNAQDEISNDEGRIWLDIIAPSGDNVRTLVGYVEDATNERDDLFDAVANRKLSLDIYSTIGEDQMRIQGRTIPFDDNDRVPIGIKIPQDGIYSIGIGALDGLFSSPSQNIYLKDLQTNTFHNLKAGPFHFNASNGELNNRFEIVYRNGMLAVDDFSQNETLKVMVNNQVTIESSEIMQEVTVYNILGQILDQYSNIAADKVTLTKLAKTQKTLLLKIKLDNGKVVNKKVVF